MKSNQLMQLLKNTFKKINECPKMCIIPGNSGLLWKAVKTAKDVNTNSILSKLLMSGIEIDNSEATDRFLNYFDTKIKDVLRQTRTD